MQDLEQYVPGDLVSAEVLFAERNAHGIFFRRHGVAGKDEETAEATVKHKKRKKKAHKATAINAANLEAISPEKESDYRVLENDPYVKAAARGQQLDDLLAGGKSGPVQPSPSAISLNAPQSRRQRGPCKWKEKGTGNSILEEVAYVIEAEPQPITGRARGRGEVKATRLKWRKKSPT